MIKRIALHEAIVDEIKKYIKKNNLKGGDKLPNQQDLTEMLGVSRTSLREALRTLQAVGIIEIKNGKGIYLKEREIYKIEANINIEDTRSSILYLHEVRRSVEGLAVRLAAERASEEDIKIMEKNINIILQKAKKGEAQPEEDKAFHTAIYNAAKNPILTDMLSGMKNILDVIWENPLGIERALNEEADLHYKMFMHIKNHEPIKAEKIFNKLMDDINLIIKNI